MRRLAVLFAVAALIAGCTDFIPMKDDFGTSALKPADGVPPEFAAFNQYDPVVDPLIANQICATAYRPLDRKLLPARPGELVASRGRCAPYDLTLEGLIASFMP